MNKGGIPFHKDLPLKRSYPGWCCPFCGEPVGYIGNFIAAIFGSRFHGCTFSNVRTSPELQAWIARQR